MKNKSIKNVINVNIPSPCTQTFKPTSLLNEKAMRREGWEHMEIGRHHFKRIWSVLREYVAAFSQSSGLNGFLVQTGDVGCEYGRCQVAEECCAADQVIFAG